VDVEPIVAVEPIADVEPSGGEPST
jgi:hypothetical protein